MHSRTITSIGGLLMVGVVFVTGLDNMCTYNGQTIENPEVHVKGAKGEICFEQEIDYQTFKQEKLRKWHLNPVTNGTIGYIGDDAYEAEEFWLLINEETTRGNIDLTNIDTSQGLETAFFNRLQSEIQGLVDSYGFVKFPSNPPRF